jgi:hypothetical protein
VIDEHHRDSQLQYERVVTMQRRIEGESVLHTDSELAAGVFAAQIEDSLQLGRGIPTKTTVSPAFSNRRYRC